RLSYCGEWIESEVPHVAMLHAPDFLGYDGAIELARDRRDLVEMALRLKKLGNELMRVIGGRGGSPLNFRLRGTAPAGPVPDRGWTHRLQHRPRHLRRRVRGALHGDPRRALERAPLD